MTNLTERQEKILEYMRNQIREQGYPPTVREICQALHIKSTSTVHKDISRLEEAGLVVKDPSKPRALHVTTADAEDFSSLPPSKVSEQDTRTDIVDIPVVGQIAAGTPILASENITDSIPVPERFLGNGNNFMLTVRGESMIEAGIMDGDYILVEQQNDARNGDIVVAAVVDGFESEATVKTFYREADHIRLQPENSSMEPIILKDCKILGKVKGVFRYF